MVTLRWFWVIFCIAGLAPSVLYGQDKPKPVSSHCSRALTYNGTLYSVPRVESHVLPDYTTPIRSNQELDRYRNTLKSYYEQLKLFNGHSKHYSYQDLQNYFQKNIPIPQNHERTYTFQDNELKEINSWIDRVRIYQLKDNVRPADVISDLIVTRKVPFWKWITPYTATLSVSGYAHFFAQAEGWMAQQDVIGAIAEGGLSFFLMVASTKIFADEYSHASGRRNNRKIVDDVKDFERAFIETQTDAAIYSFYVARNASIAGRTGYAPMVFGGFDFLFRKSEVSLKPEIYVIPWELDHKALDSVVKSSRR